MTADDAADALARRLFADALGALELYTVYVGERLGLYQALAEGGPATSAELAGRTGTVERYVREWLEHHAASGLLAVDDPAADPLTRRFRLPAGHVPVAPAPWVPVPSFRCRLEGGLRRWTSRTRSSPASARPR